LHGNIDPRHRNHRYLLLLGFSKAYDANRRRLRLKPTS